MAFQGNLKYKNQQLSAASIDLVCSNSATFFDNGQFMGNSGGISYYSRESRNILNPNSIQALSGWGWFAFRARGGRLFFLEADLTFALGR